MVFEYNFLSCRQCLSIGIETRVERYFKEEYCVRKKGFLRWIFLFAVLTILGIGYALQRKTEPIVVSTAVVTEGNLQSFLSTTAMVQSQRSENYYGVQARVKEVYVKEGQLVSKGDKLVEFDEQELENKKIQAEMQYKQTVLELQGLSQQNNTLQKKKQDKQLEVDDLTYQIQYLEQRLKQLQQKEKNTSLRTSSEALSSQKAALIQQKELLEQQKESIVLISPEKIQQAENAVQLALYTYESIKQIQQENKSMLTAGFDGMITKVNVEKGSIYNTVQPVIVMQDIENLKVDLSVGKYEAKDIHLGKSAWIYNGSRKYQGTISYIAPSAEKSIDFQSSDTSLKVSIDIDEPYPQLTIGFDVDVDILLGQAKHTIKVPGEAVRTDKKGKSYVYVLQKNKIKQREIIMGLQSETEVEVLEGISKDDKVVLNPSEELQDGLQVVVK